MTTRGLEHVGPQIRSALAMGSASGWTDGEILDHIRGAEAEAESAALAFEILVGRHGPMVLRVCRGVLRNSDDAQDAFQATFLVLARRARSIRDRESLASWLHGVALRVARHARAKDARRRRLEQASIERAASLPAAEDKSGDELGPRLHEEVGRLPERYRVAVVLCYLEGHTCEDAARVLRWPVGTVKSRLSRARERLKARLSRLGLPSVLALEAPRGLPNLPPRLASEAARFALGPPASGSAAVALAEGVLTMMGLSKLKYPAFALLVAASWVGVASTLARARPTLDPPKPPTPQVEVAQKKDDRRKPKVPAPSPAESVPLMVPLQVSARAGNGTALVYALDPKTSARVFVDEELAKAEEAQRARRKELADAGLDPEMIRRVFDASFVKSTDPVEAYYRKNPTKARVAAKDQSWKEVEAELRWVAVTGLLDHQAIVKAEALARRVELAEASPQYRRIELERQVRGPDGSWSDWSRTDQDRNYEVLDNLPQLSTERKPEYQRMESLVDPLPFLTKGTWAGVDPEPATQLLGPRMHPVSADGSKLTVAGWLAIRCLDFTVESGTTYRYRARVVAANPDFAPGRPKERLGPWSEPTREVAVP